MNIIFIVPAYQPDPRLPSLVEKLAAFTSQAVLVVNDGSRAELRSIFDQIKKIPKAFVLEHAVNLGKGAALKTAFNAALLQFPKAIGVVTVDADGQHLPEDVEKVAKQLIAQSNRMILGVRSFRSDVPLRSQFGNILTRYIFRWLIGKKVKDTQTGLRGIPLDCLPDLLRIANNRYEYELDMLVLAAQKWGIAEVSIQTVYEDGNRSSHFNPILDSLRIYFVFFRFLFASLATYIVDISTFSLIFYFSHSLTTAFISGRVLGLFVAIYGAKVFVFRSNKPTSEVAPRFLLLWLAHMTASYYLLHWLSEGWLLNVYFCRAVVDCLLYAFNFLVQREFIFSRPDKE